MAQRQLDYHKVGAPYGNHRHREQEVPQRKGGGHALQPSIQSVLMTALSFNAWIVWVASSGAKFKMARLACRYVFVIALC